MHCCQRLMRHVIFIACTSCQNSRQFQCSTAAATVLVFKVWGKAEEWVAEIKCVALDSRNDGGKAARGDDEHLAQADF